MRLNNEGDIAYKCRKQFFPEFVFDRFIYGQTQIPEK